MNFIKVIETEENQGYINLDNVTEIRTHKYETSDSLKVAIYFVGSAYNVANVLMAPAELEEFLAKVVARNNGSGIS